MAQEIADSTLLDTWGSSGAKIEPDISKIIEGWQLGEQPPHEYMNWLQNTFGSKLNHILKNGVVKWNDETEYEAGSSVQHSGNVWLCKTTNTNSEPTNSNNNWDKILSLENLPLTVDTIEDFPTGAKTGNTCIVKDLDRGGIFIYDSTKVSEDNQGTNFNGWIRQYSGAVNIKWFGAKGDGITDDTAAFQNAINLATNVYIPAGTYICSNLIIASNSTIYGTGQFSVVKQKASAHAVLFEVTANNVCLELRDFEIDQNNSNQTYGRGKFAVLSEHAGVTVTARGMTFRNCCEGAIGIVGDRTDSTIESLKITSCKFYGGWETSDTTQLTYTVLASDAAELSVTDCLFDVGYETTNGGLPAITVGATIITSAKYTKVLVSNNTFNQYGRWKIGVGIGVIDMYVWAEDAIITGNRFTNSRVTPIRGKANSQNVIVANNVIDGFISTGVSSDGTGIYFGNYGTYTPAGKNMTIVGNTIKNSTYRGIIVATNSTASQENVIIENNTIDGNTNSDAIQVQYVKNFSIRNNFITNIGAAGIAFANCEGVALISDNVIHSAGDIGISGTKEKAALYLNVTSNLLNSTTGSGITIENNTGVFIEDNTIVNVVDAGLGAGQRAIRIGGSTGVVTAQIKNNTVVGTYASGYLQVSGTGIIGKLYEYGNSWNGQVKFTFAAPTTGTWDRGSIVWNTVPTSGSYIGWVCTESGTPGTWKAFGLIS